MRSSPLFVIFCGSMGVAAQIWLVTLADHCEILSHSSSFKVKTRRCPISCFPILNDQKRPWFYWSKTLPKSDVMVSGHVAVVHSTGHHRTGYFGYICSGTNLGVPS